MADNGDGSLGALLASGAIVRDMNGDIVRDQGLCSPNNLTYNNTTYGDLVFRFRLALQYNSTIDQLVSYQTVTQ